MFRCTQCGFIWKGEAAPEACPKCGAPKEAFEQVAAEQAELMERSALSNRLHQGLVGLLCQAKEIAKRGIEDDLDPGCVKIFREVEQFADEMQRKIFAELATHMSKGKWGA